MDTKVDNFSEISSFLSVKSSLETDLMTLFGRFGLGKILSRLSSIFLQSAEEQPQEWNRVLLR
jgi:hypothetical protein